MDALTNRQRSFVQHFVRCGNASQAARDAGYAASGARQEGARLLSKADIKAAIEAHRRSYEVESGITREQVIAELEGAIGTAKAQGDVRAMISGWREIARICGYYDQPKETKVHVNIAAKHAVQQLEALSDQELLSFMSEIPPK